ncbi:hypothetical protein vseg_016014 [Gypsophila vaccaria]
MKEKGPAFSNMISGNWVLKRKRKRFSYGPDISVGKDKDKDMDKDLVAESSGDLSSHKESNGSE